MVDRNEPITAPLHTGETPPDPDDIAANNTVPSAEFSLHMAKWHHNNMLDLEERGRLANDERTREQQHVQTFALLSIAESLVEVARSLRDISTEGLGLNTIVTPVEDTTGE